MNEHYCEVWCDDIDSACGDIAHFRVKLKNDDDAPLWWTCARHYDELLAEFSDEWESEEHGYMVRY